MTPRAEPLPTCPDCGGLLQLTEPERLTSTEVADALPGNPGRASVQCLICGYQAPAPEAITIG